MNNNGLNDIMIFEIDANDNFNVKTSIDSQIKLEENELINLENQFEEMKLNSAKNQRIDYIISSFVGITFSLIDSFLLGKPNDSILSQSSDKIVDKIVCKFADALGYSSKNKTIKGAIRFLERKFMVPYDQTGREKEAKDLGLNTKNHHFKSLGHNPTIIGLIFSIISQFTGKSYFLIDGKLEVVPYEGGRFELKGNNIVSKLFYGCLNWFGHLISDVSGSSCSKNRGMGIPSSFYSWINNLIVLSNTAGMPIPKLLENVQIIAEKIYLDGFDKRYENAQGAIVLCNKFTIKLFYSFRKLINYYSSKEDKNIHAFLNTIKENEDLKKMYLVSNGVFLLGDCVDALIRSVISSNGKFNVYEFLIRINVKGVKVFTFSVAAELKNMLINSDISSESQSIYFDKNELKAHINDLKTIYKFANSIEMLKYIEHIDDKELFKIAFDESILFARDNKVPKQEIIDEINFNDAKIIPDIERLEEEFKSLNMKQANLLCAINDKYKKNYTIFSSLVDKYPILKKLKIDISIFDGFNNLFKPVYLRELELWENSYGSIFIPNLKAQIFYHIFKTIARIYIENKKVKAENTLNLFLKQRKKFIEKRLFDWDVAIKHLDNIELKMMILESKLKLIDQVKQPDVILFERASIFNYLNGFEKNVLEINEIIEKHIYNDKDFIAFNNVKKSIYIQNHKKLIMSLANEFIGTNLNDKEKKIMFNFYKKEKYYEEFKVEKKDFDYFLFSMCFEALDYKNILLNNVSKDEV